MAKEISNLPYWCISMQDKILVTIPLIEYTGAEKNTPE